MIQSLLLGLLALLGSIEVRVPAPAAVPVHAIRSCAPVRSWPSLAETGADGLERFPTVEAIAGRARSRLPFTKKGKSIVKEKNATQNDGKVICENCKVETVPGQKHAKDTTPPPNEAQVDHVIPKAKGGKGDPENGQVLCRDCNIKKSDKQE
jgi:hypothetical protein